MWNPFLVNRILSLKREKEVKVYTLFYKQHFYKQRQSEFVKKIEKS